MTFTTGGHAAFERMMRAVPRFDRAPLRLCELDLSCTRCVHFCPDSRMCRFCSCLGKPDPDLPCGVI